MEVKELLNRENIYYLEKGSDFLIKCLNPDHDDRHPSMRIDVVTGVFNCFSCGFKGNLFKLYNEEPNFLQQLKNNLGKKIDKVRASSIGLEIPKQAMPYTGTWRGISTETYEKVGAFTYHTPDFIGRLWFPIKDFSGRIVVFQGRHMDFGTPKYINYPRKVEIPMFMLGKTEFSSVILVEGIYDLLNLYDKGIKNAVCIFGVNNFNQNRLAVLKLMGVDRIFTFFDPDDAGAAATKKITKIIEDGGVIQKTISYGTKDPGELTSEEVAKLKKALYG